MLFDVQKIIRQRLESSKKMSTIHLRKIVDWNEENF